MKDLNYHLQLRMLVGIMNYKIPLFKIYNSVSQITFFDVIYFMTFFRSYCPIKL